MRRGLPELWETRFSRLFESSLQFDDSVLRRGRIEVATLRCLRAALLALLGVVQSIVVSELT